MSEELSSLSTEELKRRLEAGEKIEKVRIERLALAKKKFSFPIYMADCEIEVLDLNQSEFEEEVTIRRCNIQTLVLSKATFKKKFDFKKSKAIFAKAQRTQFQDQVIFEESQIHATFHQSVFQGNANFSRSTFVGDATFTETTFLGDANFSHTHFEKNAIFKNSKWQGQANFRNVEVEKDLSFNDSEFQKELFLTRAVVRLSIDLTGCSLHGFTSFHDVTAQRNISLLKITLGKDQGFKFQNAIAASILLQRSTVEGHVYPENKKKYGAAAQEYGCLRLIFQKLNRFDDEDWAYYQLKRMERKAKPFSWNPFSLLKRGVDYFFLELGCGYGTKPFRTLGAVATIIILFSFVYFLYFHAASPETYTGISIVDGYLYSFHISLIAFSSYGDFKIPGPIKLIAMIEFLIGTVFMGLFVVAFSRKVIRS